MECFAAFSLRFAGLVLSRLVAMSPSESLGIGTGGHDLTAAGSQEAGKVLACTPDWATRREVVASRGQHGLFICLKDGMRVGWIR
jgi:hypothetical protein